MVLRDRFNKERASHGRVTNHPALALLAHPSFKRRGIGWSRILPIPLRFQGGVAAPQAQTGWLVLRPCEARSFLKCPRARHALLFPKHKNMPYSEKLLDYF